MFSLVVRRILFSIPVLLVLTLVLFLAMKLVPGDAAVIMAGERATPEKVALIRKALHLDDPWYLQYGIYIKNLVLNFDLGRSLFHDLPITELLKTTVPATIELGLTAILIAIPVGIGLGVLSAVFRGSFLDRLATSFALSGVSMPIFWLALVLTYIFSFRLGWFPTSGRLSDEVLFTPATDSLINVYVLDGIVRGFKGEGWDVFLSALHHLVMPAFALSTIPTAHIMRMTRASFLEVLGQDYIRTARAKGLSPFSVVLKHAFRNASLQIVTITALQIGAIFGGAVLTESMFSWPGLGKVMVESIGSRDFPMVQSGTLFIGSMFVIFNLIADVLYGVLDPRVRHSS